MYRTALILEQTVGHFTFLSLSLFSFFFSMGTCMVQKTFTWFWNFLAILHFTNEKHLYEMFSDAELLGNSKMGRAVLMQ